MDMFVSHLPSKSKTHMSKLYRDNGGAAESIQWVKGSTLISLIVTTVGINVTTL